MYASSAAGRPGSCLYTLARIRSDSFARWCKRSQRGERGAAEGGAGRDGSGPREVGGAWYVAPSLASGHLLFYHYEASTRAIVSLILYCSPTVFLLVSPPLFANSPLPLPVSHNVSILTYVRMFRTSLRPPLLSPIYASVCLCIFATVMRHT